ncbi:hypothetical protein F2Q70_00010171 [Brassica cretica]|uniref:Uncharacterized protein n=1 Tax=Brassica cretica TaxID=69181 RepID=A0A8S9M2R5_BRACR|nr:hypothetical protein F2Q70_00010171 [Brassica cretica]
MNLAKISVYDNNSQAFFVLLGDAGCEWTWKHASELVDNNFEANRELGSYHEMHAPKIYSTPFGKHISSGSSSTCNNSTEIPLDANNEVDVLSASVVAGSGFNTDKRNESISNRDESQKAKRPKRGT